MSDTIRARLHEGLAQTTHALSDGQSEQLVELVELLHKWNRVYNLTAVRDPSQMVSRHLLDSLVLIPYITGGSLLDIGSGAGLPGLPLAIAMPDLSCTLLDSNGKKTRFIQHAVTELGLRNVDVVHARVEDALIAPADTIVSRAFSSPLDIISVAGQLCQPGGTIVFMLGQVDETLQSLPEGYQLDRLDSVKVPFEEGARHIAVCSVTNPNHPNHL
ncbi:MAG: 16S rRNA (guanine(527)-N(7))-methyltransferase RsmG [Granulosicoccus sp.]|nr:16S rRNA (guanine(527)-N(7))-methyltransferase RsmG [Granulosicoccus sp.]